MAQTVEFSDTWKKLAMTSVALAMNSIPTSEKIATPAAVRLGRLLGRSRRLCISWSFVKRRSMAGHANTRLKMSPGSTIAGMKTSHGIVKPKLWNDQDGQMRSAPSRKPMYQSGWTA